MSLEMFPCPHCPAEFDSLRLLEHDLGAVHHEVLPNEKFRCSTCDAEFMAQMEWMDHVRDEHGGTGRGRGRSPGGRFLRPRE